MNDGSPGAPSDERSRRCPLADLAPQSRTRGVTFLPTGWLTRAQPLLSFPFYCEEWWPKFPSICCKSCCVSSPKDNGHCQCQKGRFCMAMSCSLQGWWWQFNKSSISSTIYTRFIFLRFEKSCDAHAYTGGCLGGWGGILQSPCPFKHNVWILWASLVGINVYTHCVLPLKCEPHHSSQNWVTIFPPTFSESLFYYKHIHCIKTDNGAPKGCPTLPSLASFIWIIFFWIYCMHIR